MLRLCLACLLILVVSAMPVFGDETVHLSQDPVTGEIFLEQDGERITLLPGQAPKPPGERPGASLLPPANRDLVSILAMKPETGWEKALLWSGDGNEHTETFSLDGYWRIRWALERVVPELSPRLSILVKSAQGQILDFPVTTEMPAQGVTDTFEAGEFTLSIMSTGRWSVLVEQKR